MGDHADRPALRLERLECVDRHVQALGVERAETLVDEERRRVTCKTTCSVGDTVVIDGEALMMVDRRNSATRNAA